jgi:hypothetical protein
MDNTSDNFINYTHLYSRQHIPCVENLVVLSTVFAEAGGAKQRKTKLGKFGI